MRQFLLYAVIRLGLWALLWWLLTVAGMGVMLAGVLAALIGAHLYLVAKLGISAPPWMKAEPEKQLQPETEV
jgi:hypothetical protein